MKILKDGPLCLVCNDAKRCDCTQANTAAGQPHNAGCPKCEQTTICPACRADEVKQVVAQAKECGIDVRLCLDLNAAANRGAMAAAEAGDILRKAHEAEHDVFDNRTLGATFMQTAGTDTMLTCLQAMMITLLRADPSNVTDQKVDQTKVGDRAAYLQIVASHVHSSSQELMRKAIHIVGQRYLLAGPDGPFEVLMGSRVVEREPSAVENDPQWVRTTKSRN
ncbi:MAG: hypothetical protein EKK62_09500 [Acidimicrobiia bacterium]|nr:MAG: hypothetical protein EKK62_09500 [Acidimicrobiia bacterium]